MIMYLHICKVLREFFRLFGHNNRFYKKYKTKVINLQKDSIDHISANVQSLQDFVAYTMAKIDFKQHYGIELPAISGTGNRFEYVRIRVGEIKREWDGKLYYLTDVSPYKYLQTGNKKIYEKYVQKAIDRNICSENTVWNVKDFDTLYESIKKHGYDPTKSVICVNENNVIIDGQHRACCLLYLYGANYEINVIKVTRI